MARRRPNLLVCGASGNVARAFLRRLGSHRCHFGRLVLLDKNRSVLANRQLDHDRLAYSFVSRRLDLPADAAWFARLLRRHRIDIVLDVSTHDTLPMLAAVEAAGASYVNTSLNDSRRSVAEVLAALQPLRDQPHRAPHILCAGMNPGVVNLWVRHGVERFGRPRQIVHFEFDDSMTVDGWRPLVTWSRHEFLTETAWNPTGHHTGDRVLVRSTNALQNPVALRPLLAPLALGDHCPAGMLVLHEENLTLGELLGVPSKFIYALHPQTMRYLRQRFRRHGRLGLEDIELGDNVTRRLTGTDIVGVCLHYPNRRIYYLNRMPNDAVIGTNATCAQVAVGIYAALFTLIYDQLEPRIYFTEDLFDKLYRRFVMANMRVELFLCSRRKGRWVVRKHLPELRDRSPGHGRPLVI